MNETDDEEISELTVLTAEKVSGVATPANGTPFLLMKAAAQENHNMPASLDIQAQHFIDRGPVTHAVMRRAIEILETQGVPKVKKNKKAKVKKSVARLELARKSAGDAIKAYATDRVLRMAALERAVKSAPNNPAFAYQLSHLLLKQGREDDMRAARGLPPLDVASAIRQASAPAMANATGKPLNPGPHNPRAALQSVADSTYVSQSLPRDQTELPSLVQIHELEKQLDDAQSGKGPDAMQRVVQLSYQLTRARLIQGHGDGSLRSIGR
jgi:hypothetical protein